MSPFETVDRPDLNQLHDHGNPEMEKAILHHMPDLTRIQNVAKAMKQLGDPSRLRIFWLLCHTEECVSDISLLVGMSSPAISHHLRLLKNAGLQRSPALIKPCISYLFIIASTIAALSLAACFSKATYSMTSLPSALSEIFRTITKGI